MKYSIIIFLVLALNTIWSCGVEPDNLKTSYKSPMNVQYETQLLFSTIEHNLYSEEKELAQDNTKYLISSISNNQKIYCYEDTEHIALFLKSLFVFKDDLSHENIQWSLERLRDLKGKYIGLQTRDEYDPYLYQLWRFEEQMYYTTKAAMDPKLDLYEWGEFQMMIDCMNEDWQLVNLHYPSIELFGNNELGYKIQTMAKIHLQKSIDEFNKAIQSDDYINYDLCSYATSLREKYINYIKTFIAQEEELLPFLAKV